MQRYVLSHLGVSVQTLYHTEGGVEATTVAQDDHKVPGSVPEILHLCDRKVTDGSDRPRLARRIAESRFLWIIDLIGEAKRIQRFIYLIEIHAVLCEVALKREVLA